jgi:hypothetical protein
MSDVDLWARIEDLLRRIATLENLATARAPMAIAGQAFQSTVTLTDEAFDLGDVLKCVANVWSLATSADTGPLMMGVVTMVSGSTITVTLAGERADSTAAGVPGTLYWVPDVGGNAQDTPSTTGLQRCIERQISPTMRLVLPDPLGWFAVSITTCDGGSPVAHGMAYYLNNT